jgi:hypothetical protein
MTEICWLARVSDWAATCRYRSKLSIGTEFGALRTATAESLAHLTGSPPVVTLIDVAQARQRRTKTSRNLGAPAAAASRPSDGYGR